MPEEDYDKDFPNLKKLWFRKIETPAKRYFNCIAYVVGDFRRRWWPGDYIPSSGDYWPAEAPKEESLNAFLIALGTVGYALCADGRWEDGFEKIAIYALGCDLVKHAARLHAEGIWRSKLFIHEMIEHPLEGLEGPCYGKVVAYLKRRKKQNSSDQPHSVQAEPK